MGGRAIERLRWRYLARTPSRGLVVQYEATTDLGVIDLAVVANGSTTEVVTYPDDPALPVLSDRARLAVLAGEPGGFPERLAWVPLERATLRFAETVVKVYADPIDAIGARDRMDRVTGRVATARPVRLDVADSVVVQTVVEGRPLDRSDAGPWAAAAIGLLQQLQDAEFDGLPILGPHEALELAAGPVALVGACRPDLAVRLQQVTQRLQIDVPALDRPVVAHGDYNVGQLLATAGGGLAVIDVDTLCLASRSFDLAGYVTNVVSGRRDDPVEAWQLLDELGRHTELPDDLSWYVAVALLRRVDRAIRRLKRDWPKRTERLVEAVEAALTR